MLIGTVSVEKSEYLSRRLGQLGIPHSVLNAKQHTQEAAVVAQAGRLQAVTVATNMAGRGVDIILGGNPEGLARHEALKEGHAAEVMVDDFALPAPLDQMPDEFREARAKALGRYQELLEVYRTECAAEGDKIRELGGLYVIGSERHESRRIDNQLRGRSGRQGDPGASRFYLSLDDELMRLFATGALSYVMNKALPEDEAIEAKMVTKAIERAQTTVETRNAEIRKNVLKYDEVMNEQRKVIYARRDQILEGADLKSAAMEYLNEAVDALLETYCASPAADEWDLDGLDQGAAARSGRSTITEERLAGCRNTKEMAALIDEDATAHYGRREAELTPTVMREVERQVMLRIIDQRWREHLEEMDYLKEGINLRAMGQKDPLIEWQREGFEMFGSMMKAHRPGLRPLRHARAGGPARPAAGTGAGGTGRRAPARRRRRHRHARRRPSSATCSRCRPTRSGCRRSPPLRPRRRPPSASSSSRRPQHGRAAQPGRRAARRQPQVPKQETVVKDEWSKTPRNAPCPCGSGKKFKLCHGK